jgi:tetratricopeptide (TPR) repeat protein
MELAMSDYDQIAHESTSPIRRRSWDVFISYAREDAAIANSLGEAIEARGLTTWFDAKLKDGEPLQAINQALRSSGAAIVLLSTASLSSPWLRKEVAEALNALPRDRVFPIAVGEMDVRNLPSWLSDRQWLHLRDPRNVTKLVDKLLPVLEAMLGGRDDEVGTAQLIGEIPPRVPLVGVDTYLSQLRRQRAGITWIVGRGGIGKTALALEYAFQVRNKVDFILWLSGEGAHAPEFEQQLCLIEDQTRRAGHGPGLIVVDGLDSVSDDLREAIGRLDTLGGHHRILITIRRVGDAQLMREHKHSILMLGPLSPADVGDYLDAVAPKIKPQERRELERVAQSMGGSPFLLRLVTQALRLRSVDDVLSAPTTNATINRALQILRSQLSEVERQRLDVLSFCSGLLTTVRTNKHWRLPGDDELFTRLLDWGLCAQLGEKTVFHDLILELLRQDAPRPALEEAIAYVTQRLPDPSDAGSQEFLPSVVELTELTELDWSQDVSANLAELLIWQASVWRSAGEPERAELLCPRALVLAEKSDQTLLRIRAMNLQSALAFERGRVSEASEIERHTSDIALEILGPDHPITIASLANLATTLRAQGDLAGAITLLRQVVDQSQAVLAPDHPDLVAAQSNLAICLREVGYVHEAMELLIKATSHTTNNRVRLGLDRLLAALLADEGKLEEASTVLTNSLARVESAHSSGSTDVLMARANLAMIYARLGRIHEGLSIQSEVVDRFEVMHGPDHPSTLSARNNYALLLSEAGSPSDALQLFSEVAASRARTLGPDHPETLQSQLLAARETSNQSEHRRALEMYSDLLSRVVRVLGPEHAMSFTVREELAEQLGQIGHVSGAQLAYRELLADLDSVLPPDHPMIRRVQASATQYTQ